MKIMLRLSVMTGLFVLVCGVAHGQQVNPNKLAPCTGTDTAKWTNCYGSASVPNVYNYLGDFLNGEFHGYGVMDVILEKFKGDKYAGEFANGRQNGYGTYTYVKVGVYVGQFKHAKKNGHGTFIFVTGDKYVGEYKDDERNGQGTVTLANGEKYVGEFKDGKYNGQGIFTLLSGGKKEGIFENGEFVRAEKLNLPNPNIAGNTDRTDIDRERQQLAEERRKLEEENVSVNNNDGTSASIYRSHIRNLLLMAV